MKIVNVDISFSYLLNDLRNFNETFRKDVTYDNIKSCKKTGLPILFVRYFFEKPHAGIKFTTPAVIDIKIGFSTLNFLTQIYLFKEMNIV